MSVRSGHKVLVGFKDAVCRGHRALFDGGNPQRQECCGVRRNHSFLSDVAGALRRLDFSNLGDLVLCDGGHQGNEFALNAKRLARVELIDSVFSHEWAGDVESHIKSSYYQWLGGELDRQASNSEGHFPLRTPEDLQVGFLLSGADPRALRIRLQIFFPQAQGSGEGPGHGVARGVAGVNQSVGSEAVNLDGAICFVLAVAQFLPY